MVVITGIVYENLHVFFCSSANITFHNQSPVVISPAAYIVITPIQYLRRHNPDHIRLAGEILHAQLIMTVEAQRGSH
jgi:hypothetical protein